MPMVLPYGGRVGRRRAFFYSGASTLSRPPSPRLTYHSMLGSSKGAASRICSWNKKKPLYPGLFPVATRRLRVRTRRFAPANLRCPGFDRTSKPGLRICSQNKKKPLVSVALWVATEVACTSPEDSRQRVRPSPGFDRSKPGLGSRVRHPKIRRN
jgi:hypothetical protein